MYTPMSMSNLVEEGARGMDQIKALTAKLLSVPLFKLKGITLT